MNNLKKNTSENCNLTIIIDDKEYDLKAPKTKTILEVAIDAGLDPSYSCQGGFCTSCMATITEGKAEMEENETLDENEISEGKTLTCVARPTTDKLVVNFDL